MARGWKRPIEWMIARSGMAGAVARYRHPGVVILAYHNIVPRGEGPAGDLSLHVDQEDFGEQLDRLLQTHDVVPLADLNFLSTEDLEDPDASPRSKAVITFDDAYAGTMTAGLEELGSRNLPATVFVPPGLLGRGGFWWDLLAGEAGLDPRVRTHALNVLHGRADRVLAWARESGIRLQALPDHAQPVDESLLRTSSSYDSVSLGAHSWTHPNLSVLRLEEVREEYSQSKAWLERNARSYVNWFSYPYGLFSPAAAREAAAQFDGCLCIDGGVACSRGQWVSTREAVPRINVPRGLSREGMALRLSGIAQ